MTSRVHNEPSAWTHESRARSLPASGALSHELSLVGCSPRLANVGRGRAPMLRAPDSARSPKQPPRRGLSALRHSFVQSLLTAFPNRQRDRESFHVDPSSHQRRSVASIRQAST